MATPSVLDFEKLLAPISDDQPAGPELRQDGTLSESFYNVKDARNAASEAERRLRAWSFLSDEDKERELGDGIPKPDGPDWRPVFDMSRDIIAEKSKDLWVTAWLIESLVRIHGFAGLRDGFRLARELSEQFWDGINPPPDEDGYATTVSQLTGLNGDDSDGTLMEPIRETPITGGNTNGPFTSTDYIDAVEMEKLDPSARSQRIEHGAASLDMINSAVGETPVESLQDLMDDITQSLDEFSALSEVLEERCGKNEDGYPAAPPTSNIRNALIDCQDRLKSIAGHILVVEEEVEEEGGKLSVTGNNGVATVDAKVQTREDAFRALLQVSDFFRRTEPHSPVSYALEQAVRWGRMSLPELMSELISDDSIRKTFFQRTGIPADGDE